MQASKAEPVFLPVEVIETPAVVPVPVAAPVKRRRLKAEAMIEIALGSGRSLKVGAEVAIETAKLTDVDARAWLADVLARLPGHPATQAADLLPWNGAKSADARQAA